MNGEDIIKNYSYKNPDLSAIRLKKKIKKIDIYRQKIINTIFHFIILT